jgi:hypothetical protein
MLEWQRGFAAERDYTWEKSPPRASDLGDHGTQSLPIVPAPHLSGISALACDRPTLYTPLGTPAHKYFLRPGPMARGQSPDYANASPPLLVAAFPWLDYGHGHGYSPQ